MILQLTTGIGDALTNFPPVGESMILTGLFKFLFILTMICYAAFSVVVIRQVQIMKNTLITPISPIFLTLAIFHTLAAVFVLGLFFLIL